MSLDSKFYTEDVKTIKRVRFNVFTNTEIKKYSSVSNDPFGINVPDSYDNYEPKKGGLVDLRLGTCDPYLPCSTCGLNWIDCPGHFGHTELSDYVFHYGFLKHLKSLLQCICLKCSNILFEKEDDTLIKFKNKSSKNRFTEIKNLTKNVSFCWNCGTPVPKIKKEIKENSASIRISLEREVGTVSVDEKTGDSSELRKKIKEYLSPRECYNILRNISDTDCFLLGFNSKYSRPEDLIMKRFPVPPVCIRPTGKIDFMASSTMEDSLTLKIADIIKSNLRVRARMDKEASGTDLSTYGQDFRTLLQFHIATFFDNESASLPRSEFKTGNKLTKSISDRIRAKGGRVRANLMGKRVDFSARSVITSDPYIDIDEVGVPLKVAMNMTIPEEVTPKNINHLSKLVKNGANKYPGANYILRKIFINGKSVNQKIDLKYRKKDIKLSYGDVVRRHIINGDYVLFNRQPTLHKPSMMGHRIHVLNRDDCNTFRMNVSVTEPYNADFDGDEMNIHLAQSIQARNELARITNVKYQIVGAKDSNPIIGCVQDSVSGAFLLSSDDTLLELDECSNLISNTKNDEFDFKKGKKYTGKELFSRIIPDGINSSKGTKFQIKDGSLVKGRLDKSQLASKKNSIIHYVWDKYGADKTQKFIDNSQRLVLNYLLLRGLSIGFGDCILEKPIFDKIQNYVNTKLLDSKIQITQYENDQDKISPDIIESSIQSELSALGANVGKIIMDSLDETNNFYVLIKSGAKGNNTNIQKGFGCIGQISVEGKRIQKKVNGRTIPHFHKDDDTPEARGFVDRTYLDGIEGHHYFFDAMAGRSGLIDTAIKTATTGYIQRKLIKGLEDISVKYDGTVRSSSGKLIQYIYGGNGINQLTQTEVKLNLIEYSNDDIRNNLIFSKKELKKIDSKYAKDNEKYYKSLVEKRDYLRNIIFDFTLNYKIVNDKVMLPVNLYRITQEFNTGSKKKTDLKPKYVEDGIDDILSDFQYRLLTYNNNVNELFKKDEKNFKILLRIALMEYLAPKKCIIDYGLDKKRFDELCQEIKNVYIRSMVEPGEMVGIIAGQSIGEPTSQMTLNTKHMAGVVSTANMGVPRIQELLSYSKSPKTPQMTVYLKNEHLEDKQFAKKISSNFKHLILDDLINSVEVYYTTGSKDSNAKILKDDNTKIPFFINNSKTELDSLPIVFRLDMNIEKMLNKDTTILDIKTKFISYWYNYYSNLKLVKKDEKEIIGKIDKLAILGNNDNIIHIRFSMNTFNYNDITKFLNLVLNKVTLKGMNKISDSNVIEQRRIHYDSKTGEQLLSKENIIVTSGINFRDLKKINGIDFDRTLCNDIYTTLKLYGIEAARNILYHEFVTAFTSDNLNHNHLALLVDLMTNTGDITPMDRFGLSKLDSDPMTKASFERTMDHFINAALFNEVDHIESVSSRIMVGRVINGGTGAFDLLLNVDKLQNTEYTSDETGGRVSFQPLVVDSMINDLMKFGLNENDFYIQN